MFLKQTNRTNRIIIRILYIVMIFGFSLTFSSLIFAQEREQRSPSEPIEEHPNVICLEQGKQLFWEQEYSEAIEQLEICLEQDPENPEIYYYIGQSYFQQGQQSAQSGNPIRAYQRYRKAYELSDTAIEKYQQQIEAYPEEDHTNQYLRLAYIYEIRSLIPGVDEFQEALDIYQKLLEERPYISSAYYHMGWIYYQQEKYQEAINVYLKYLEPGLKSDFVYYHLGLSYDKIGEKEKAEHYYNLILEEFPDTEFANRAKKELN
jgi:tetratricopeptide (TPR) repeat protein